MQTNSTPKDVLSYVGNGMSLRLKGVGGFFLVILWIRLIARWITRQIGQISGIISTILQVIVWVVAAAVALFMLYGTIMLIKGLYEEKKYNRRLVNGPESDAIVKDFDTSVSFFNDTLRLGKKYVFGRGCGRTIRYSEIAEVYQTIRTYHKGRHKGKERNRTLTCELIKDAESKGQNEYTIGKLKHLGESCDELASVFAMMTSANSQISISGAHTE